jgi:hypothetical protein
MNEIGIWNMGAVLMTGENQEIGEKPLSLQFRHKRHIH